MGARRNRRSRPTTWSRGNFSMDPKAVHKPETKHDHQHKGAAVTNQWQWHTRDGKQSNRHSHVLEDVRENKCRDSDNQKVFFQAEDGIRDLTVTGVQTCALPI